MKNLFENAFFGKAYKTRDGRKAYFRHYQHGEICPYMCLIDGKEQWYRLNGKTYIWKEDDYDNPVDIISEWKEEISEEELDRLAKEYVDNSLPLLDGDAISCFKAGFRKAMEG